MFAGLESAGLLDGIERIAGTSGGSLSGLLLALGYSVPEMKSLVDSLDFSKFEDGGLIDDFKILSRFGLHPGNELMNFIQGLIKKKTGNPLSTFSDFKKAGFKDLTVFAASLNSQGIIAYGSNTPDVPVCYAIRSSISIPLFFQAYQVKEDINVDGGTCFNYPLEYFDTDGINMETIGGHFIGGGSDTTDLKFGETVKYIKSLAETAINAQEVYLQKSAGYKERTIELPTLGISAINFGVNQVQKDNLYSGAVLAVGSFFANRN